jgi:subtilisin family serine protease
MPKLKVIVNKLNKRTGPVTDFSNKGNIVGTLSAGDIFTSVSTTTNNLGTWHVDENGFVVWSGGIISTEITAPSGFNDYQHLQFIPSKMSWAHEFLEIPLIWQEIHSAGASINIAVIDSGANISVPDLSNIILPKSISIDTNGSIDNATNLSDRLRDNVGHGTKMAGIIGAAGIKVYGVAPESKLLIIKVTDSFAGLSPVVIAKAFDWLSSQNDIEVDIISASFAVNDNPEIRKHVEACLSKGMALFGAIGDDHFAALPEKQKDTFPACYPSCTAVGSFDPSGQLCTFSNWNDNLALLAPGDENILTIGADDSPTVGEQTSIATAICSASFALLLSLIKAEPGYTGKATDYLKYLYETANDMGPVLGRDAMHGFGRVNIRNAISKFINENS